MLTERMQRAFGIYAAGDVRSRGNGRYGVISENDRSVEYAVRKGYCNCPDFANRGDQACKHILAVGISLAVDSVISSIW